jgi:hypothetical protein
LIVASTFTSLRYDWLGKVPESRRGETLEPVRVVQETDSIELVPCPAVHPDRPSLAALPMPEEHCAAGTVEVALLEREGFADPQLRGDVPRCHTS